MRPLSSPRHRMIATLSLGLIALGVFLIVADAPWQGLAARALKRGRAYEVAEYVQVGLWWAGAGVAGLLALLLITLPWWWKWTERETPAAPTPLRPGRWEYLIVLAALALGGWLRVPLMDQGIKWDEHDNLRRNFHGFTALDQAAKGDPWRPAGYREALFENERSNNPFLYSVLAHASLDAWRLVSGAPRDRFNVVAMRVPALLAGMGGLLTAWLLARRLGGPWAAMLTILLLAMHPLHVRYSVDARGYALVLLLAPVFLQCGLSLLQQGTWRLAFATAFTAAAVLYAFPGAVYFIGMGGVGLILALWSQRDRATFVRMTVAGLLALATLLFLLAPALMQASKSLDSQFQKTGLPLSWFFQTWHWMSVGVHLPGENEFFEVRDGSLPWGSYLTETLRTEFPTALMAWFLLPALLVWGAWRLSCRGSASRFVLLAGVTAPVLCLLHHGLLTHYAIFQWYMIYSLPVLMMLPGLAIAEMPTRVRLMASGLLLPLFWLASNPQHPELHANLRGYTLWNTDPELPTARSLFQRGPNLWETWPDGRVLRLPKPAMPVGMPKDATSP